MKVALLLTGHARTYKIAYKSIKKQLLDRYDVDVYLSTWSVDNAGRAKGTADWAEPMPLDLNGLIDTFNPVKVHVEDHDNFYANRFPNIDIESSTRPDDVFKVNAHAAAHGSFWIERLRDQWYMVKKGWELIENPNQYDCIVRLRLDTYLDDITLTTDNLVTPNRPVDGIERGAVCDLMAYGPPAHMERYCKLFDYFEPMYINDNVNIVHADEVLGVYLKKYCGIYPTLVDIGFHWAKDHR